MKKLTIKQKKFADEYIKTGNATQSAINAGYSKKTARVTGAENLTKPNIKAYVDERMK
ncbi:MAG: terminase small subunit, partial [Peptoniphilus lacrimalis]